MLVAVCKRSLPICIALKYVIGTSGNYYRMEERTSSDRILSCRAILDIFSSKEHNLDSEMISSIRVKRRVLNCIVSESPESAITGALHIKC